MQSKTGSRIFWGAFWLTLIVLAAFYGYAQWQINKLKLDEHGKLVARKNAIAELKIRLPGVEQDIAAELQQAGRAIDSNIDANIDAVFAPVYDQITKFADFHYSVIGEYTEMAAALTGEVSRDLERILFDAVDFQDRLERYNAAIFADARQTLDRALQNIETSTADNLALSKDDLALLGDLIAFSIEDAEARFSSEFVILRGVGLLAGTKATGAALAKIMGKKLATKLAAKAAAKTALKGTAIGGSAATGAAVGSIVPGLGTAIGGVVGAVIGWFATDKIIVEVDEYFNRDEFVADLTAQIDAEKARLKTQIKHQYTQFINHMQSDKMQKLRELINADPKAGAW